MLRLLARTLARPAVADWLIRRALRRPYSPIIKDGDLYMDRYWLFNPYPDTGASGADRKRWQFPISIRVHHIVLPDQDRDMHDHPWNARTTILRGNYTELRLIDSRVKQFMRFRGDTATLAFGDFHRITDISEGGVWTMFVAGKYRGSWGFDVNGTKVPWRTYIGLPEKVSSAPPLQDKHDTQRQTWRHIFIAYAFFIGLAVWTWW
jgi:hypothetical protein